MRGDSTPNQHQREVQLFLGKHKSAGVMPPTIVEPRPPRNTYLPFALPHITEAEIDEVRDTLRSGWLSTGPKTKRFEQEFAQAVGASYAVAVNSATAALHLALDAIGIGADDEVIVPVYTFTSTAAVIVHRRARPVFVDVDQVTCNLDPEQLEAAITSRTRAIIVVHIAGLPAEMDAILAIARAHGIRVIEDAAHAFPAKYRGRMVGTIGDMTAFSFYATKTLATGEGGMLTTDNPDYAQRATIMALHGISRDAWKRYSAEGSWYYEVLEPGYKYNMPDLAASLGLHQLARRDWLLERRRAIAQRYTAAFSRYDELETPPDPVHVEHAWHLYMLRLRPERLSVGRDEFIRALAAAKIGTSVHFIPLHLHPYYRAMYCLTPQDFPYALDAYQREISLPIYPGMSEDDIEDVIAAVEAIIIDNHRVSAKAGWGAGWRGGGS
jgi:dTDP-4-amino-4,6-dideoxygalactose transaminase